MIRGSTFGGEPKPSGSVPSSCISSTLTTRLRHSTVLPLLVCSGVRDAGRSAMLADMPNEPTPPGFFWSSVQWPLKELAFWLGIAVFLGVVVGVFRPDPFYRGSFLLVITSSFVALTLVAWVPWRVFLAWVRWPSRSRVVRCLKAVAAFMLADSHHRSRD